MQCLLTVLRIRAIAPEEIARTTSSSLHSTPLPSLPPLPVPPRPSSPRLLFHPAFPLVLCLCRPLPPPASFRRYIGWIDIAQVVNERFLNLFAECLRSPDEQVVQRSCSCILEVVNKV